ncbi:MAG: Fpg/Nei family DNA glycosylase [Methanosarcinales archaeon]|nr:Fpg/Nei family DNA glycosylase [Methanosarcinales archaeon]
MPELPEVETFRRYLESTSLHQPIQGVEVRNSLILDGLVAPDLEQALLCREFGKTMRHGKILFASLHECSWLVLHFGMTGCLKYFSSRDEVPHHSRLIISFSSGFRLAFVDMRMFGRAGLTEDPQRYIGDKGLGPDALQVDKETFRSRVLGRRGMIKTLLLNQRLIAGLGNLYADEALFQAKIHPAALACSLSRERIDNLFSAIGMVLKMAVSTDADFARLPDDYLLSSRHPRGRCPLDRSPLEIIKIGGRTTYYCPAHQK